jgi:hypothetical protein
LPAAKEISKDLSSAHPQRRGLSNHNLYKGVMPRSLKHSRMIVAVASQSKSRLVSSSEFMTCSINSITKARE